VAQGVGAQLGAVEGHVPELHEAGLAAESQHLQEEAGKGSEVAAAKGGDAGVVGVLIGT